MVDYRDEVRLGKEVLSRTVEAYRKIRNTLGKYLLSNLYDFDPARRCRRSGADARGRSLRAGALRALAATVQQAYAAYDFQTIFHAINEFVTVDLSAFYLDVSKDRLYTFRADSVERRSAQTAIYIIADGVARLLAPILSITADEIWRFLPGTREESVHLALFPSGTGALARRGARGAVAAAARRARRRSTRRSRRAAAEGDRQRALGARDDSRRRARSRTCSSATPSSCPCCSSRPGVTVRRGATAT